LSVDVSRVFYVDGQIVTDNYGATLQNTVDSSSSNKLDARVDPGL